MNQHTNNWSNKDALIKTARTRIAYNNQYHADDIKYTLERSVVVDDTKMATFFETSHAGKSPLIYVEAVNTVDLINNYDLNLSGKTAVLNFASFRNPGGKFIEGSSAQEETLCRWSTLYNVLSDESIVANFYNLNKTKINNGLYVNRAVCTPNIVFDQWNDSSTTLDVITCAAVNAKFARDNGISEEVIRQSMKDRIDFVFRVAHMMGVKNLYLGAFGCGVFANDTEYVARCFADAIKNNVYASHVDKVIFPILPGYNFNTFMRVFGEEFPNEE